MPTILFCFAIFQELLSFFCHFSMDVRQRYGQLVSALGNKSFLLGGQNLVDKIDGEDGQMGPTSEEAIFEQLGQIRSALNSVKCRVNSVCARNGTARWHSFTSFTHPLKGLPAWVSSRVLDSFVVQQQQCELMMDTSPLLLLYTQAFCKFVQLVDAQPEVLAPFQQCRHRQIGQRLPRSLHLCELPGAFVVALKHTLDPVQSDALQWFINGLNPHWEWSTTNTTASTSPPPSSTHCSKSVVADLNNDLLLLTGDNDECAVAAFGWSGAGDVLPADEWDDAFLAYRFGIAAVAAETNNNDDDNNKFDLVTADGGFDCADNPSCQESLTLPLMKRQCQIALKCLRRGGTLLLKAFTFFERETVALIGTLCATFGEVRCNKPPSSKPGNSEVYLLCLDFKGGIFADVVDNDRCHFDQGLLRRILNAARTLAGHQIGFIEFNLATFRRLSQDERTIISIEKCAAVERWGAQILGKIRPDQRPQMAPSHFSWHQNWHPKNADKICRLMAQLTTANDATPVQFGPRTFTPNCAPFLEWLLSSQHQQPQQKQHITTNAIGTAKQQPTTTTNGGDSTTNNNNNNGICIDIGTDCCNGGGGGGGSAFVVFGRIGDPGQRSGTRPVDHSLFAHPNWLKRTEKVHDLCSGDAHEMDDDHHQNGADKNVDSRPLSKLGWLDFLIEQCQAMCSANLSTFELPLGQSEAILSRFSASVFLTLCSLFRHVEHICCPNGSAKLRFSQPNRAICAPLSLFLTNIRMAYKARVVSDHRWTLLKFVPLRFFDMPTRTIAVGGVEGSGDEQLRLGEQIAEFNARTIALLSLRRPSLLASPVEEPNAKRMKKEASGT